MRSHFRELAFDIQPYVFFGLARVSLVQDRYLDAPRFDQRAETFSNVRLRTTGDEEFNIWDHGRNLSKGSQHRQNRFLVVASVQGVDYDYGWSTGYHKGLDDQFFHLVTWWGIDDSWILEDRREIYKPKHRTQGRELAGKFRENAFEVEILLEFSRAEEE